MFSWVVLVAFFHIQHCWNFSKAFCWSQLKNCSNLIQFTHYKHRLPHFPSFLVSSVVAYFFPSFFVQYLFFFLKECKIRCQQALSSAILVCFEMEFTCDEPEVKDRSYPLKASSYPLIFPHWPQRRPLNTRKMNPQMHHLCMVRGIVQPATHPEEVFSNGSSKRSYG